MSDYWFIGLGAIIALGASIFSYYEKTKENKISNKSNAFNNSTFIFITLGVIVGIISGVNSHYEKIKSDKEKKSSDSIALSSQNKLQEKSDLIIQIQKESKSETKNLNDSLGLAKQKIIMLQDEINQNIVGSTEPCYLDLNSGYDKKGSTVIINNSKLPVYDLSIYITDFIKVKQCKISKSPDYIMYDEPCFIQCTKMLFYPITRHGVISIQDEIFPESVDRGLFEIRLIYKVGVEYLEQLIYEKNGNNIVSIIRLLKKNGNIYKTIKIINPNNIPNIDFDKEFNLPLRTRGTSPIFWR